MFIVAKYLGGVKMQNSLPGVLEQHKGQCLVSHLGQFLCEVHLSVVQKLLLLN